jgi:hypothetical protein
MEYDSENYNSFADPVYPPPYSNKERDFAISASLNILTHLPVKRFFGLFNSEQKIDLPKIPNDAVMSDTQITEAGVSVRFIKVSAGFLETHTGSTFFKTYCEALATHRQAYPAQYTPALNKYLLNWNLNICIPEAASEYGFIDLWAFEAYGFERLEQTASALRQPIRDDQTLVLNDDSLENEGDVLLEKYVSFAHYMAATKSQVLIHAYDFDAEDDAAAEVMHKYSLDKNDFSRTFTRTVTLLKKQLTQICAAIQVSPSSLNPNIWEANKVDQDDV